MQPSDGQIRDPPEGVHFVSGELVAGVGTKAGVRRPPPESDAPFPESRHLCLRQGGEGAEGFSAALPLARMRDRRSDRGFVCGPGVF